MKQQIDVKGGAEVVSPLLLKRLREIVSPPGKKGTWLRKLNNRRLAEVYMRLRMGQSAFKIAQIAQREWNIMPKSSTRSLCRAVYMFAKEAIGEIKAGAVEGAHREEIQKQNAALEKRSRRLNEKLDGMQRLAWLIERQTERFEMALGLEKKTKMPMKQTDVIVKRLVELLDKYLDFAIKLGLIDSKPPELNLNVKHMFDGLVGQFGDDGQKVVTAGYRFLELASESSMLMTLGADGSYHLSIPDEEAEEHAVSS